MSDFNTPGIKKKIFFLKAILYAHSMSFFRQYPALYWAIALLFAVGIKYTHLAWLLGIIFCFHFHRWVIIVILLRFFTFQPWVTFQEGFISGQFFPQSIEKQVYGRGYQVKGLFTTEKKSAPMIVIGIPNTTRINKKLWIQGRVRNIEHGQLLFAQKTHPIAYTFSLCSLRFQLQQQLYQFLQKHISDQKIRAYSFAILSAVHTDKTVDYLFSRVGLSHILAISGLHFSIMIGFFVLFLRKIVSRKCLATIAIICSLLFVLFIGHAPSVTRAWIFSTLTFFSVYVLRNPKLFNTLGAAFCIELIVFPHMVTNVGFWLSYLATFAMLTLFPTLRLMFFHTFPQKTEGKTFLEKLFLALSLFFMNSFLLSLSITLLLVPLIFHIFHELPLLSLFYNTFFTPIFALHIALLLLSCLFPFLFPLYTKISKIFFYPIFHPPHLLHIILRAPPFSLNTCILIEGFLVLLTFSLWNYKKNTVAKYKKIYHNHFRLRR